MTEAIFLGINVGTGSARAGIFDAGAQERYHARKYTVFAAMQDDFLRYRRLMAGNATTEGRHRAADPGETTT